MVINKVYSPEEINFGILELYDRIEPKNVLMCTPAYFEVMDVKNIHMQEHIGQTNKSKANQQWEAIRDIYKDLVQRSILDSFNEIHGAEGLEDMVFAANQTFPWILQSGEKVVVLSNMKFVSRQNEVPHFRKFFEDKGYRLIDLETKDYFEGMGDTIAHPGKRLLYGGFGHRTEKEVFSEIAEKLEVPVVTLELVDERFYHLDTCFLPLDEDHVILCPEAFSLTSLQALEKLFKNIIRISGYEAEKTFALNAHIININPLDTNTRKIAIIQYGSVQSYEHLSQHQFEVKEVDTSEYMNSGGSVFCMKMMFY